MKTKITEKKFFTSRTISASQNAAMSRNERHPGIQLPRLHGDRHQNRFLAVFWAQGPSRAKTELRFESASKFRISSAHHLETFSRNA